MRSHVERWPEFAAIGNDALLALECIAYNQEGVKEAERILESEVLPSSGPMLLFLDRLLDWEEDLVHLRCRVNRDGRVVVRPSGPGRPKDLRTVMAGMVWQTLQPEIAEYRERTEDTDDVPIELAELVRERLQLLFPYDDLDCRRNGRLRSAIGRYVKNPSLYHPHRFWPHLVPPPAKNAI